MASRQDNREPERGDLIEIFMPTYQHWAVYVGGGYIVNLVEGSSSSDSTAKKERLTDVVGTRRWRVNNSRDSKYTPRPVSAIVEEAHALVGEKLTYSLLTHNCEHFATKLRYGIADCQQIMDTILGGPVRWAGALAGALFGGDQ